MADMSDYATLTTQQKLDRLRQVEIELIAGGGATMIRDSNGEQVSFGRGNMAALTVMIRKLEAQLRVERGLPPTIGPMRPYF